MHWQKYGVTRHIERIVLKTELINIEELRMYNVPGLMVSWPRFKPVTSRI